MRESFEYNYVLEWTVSKSHDKEQQQQNQHNQHNQQVACADIHSARSLVEKCIHAILWYFNPARYLGWVLQPECSQISQDRLEYAGASASFAVQATDPQLPWPTIVARRDGRPPNAARQAIRLPQNHSESDSESTTALSYDCKMWQNDMDNLVEKYLLALSCFSYQITSVPQAAPNFHDIWLKMRADLSATRWRSKSSNGIEIGDERLSAGFPAAPLLGSFNFDCGKKMTSVHSLPFSEKPYIPTPPHDDILRDISDLARYESTHSSQGQM